MIGKDELQALIARELAWIEIPERRAALEAILVEPRLEEGDWDYGAADQTYPYWVVAETPARDIVLVWADQGFGPEFPWGFLFPHPPARTLLGKDAQWSWYLEEAFVRAGLSDGEIDEAWDQPPDQRPPRD